MTQTERIEVETDTAGCDGGGGPLGHPMVYLKIVPQSNSGAGEGEGSVVCPYCSRQFVRKPGDDTSTGH
ncbi:MAG: zinc-finger domain-containing protein [Alphaproteobacteria bacterium]|jgi:uncharacterized Zn-finger protein|nr:zinc-finger domain-containing protein [Alphaproteobacteria bacterium]MBT7943529.1 zinc-finger domain-containing protein [Alphaproteobacteria bacterium]